MEKTEDHYRAFSLSSLPLIHLPPVPVGFGVCAEEKIDQHSY